MTNLADLITVLVCTSPTASDPSTESIRATVNSARGRDLRSCKVLIGADGVRPAQRAMTDAYAAMLDGIREHAPGIVRVKRLPAWGHQANVLRMLLAEVTTPLVLFLEHDCPLTPDVEIDWVACAQTLLEGELHSIRFLHEAQPLPEHRHLFLDQEPVLSLAGTPHMRTAQWSQRPHLARTDWYRWLIDTYFAPSSRTMVEDCLYGVVTYHWREYGVPGWEKFKLAIYADPEPTMQRSYHLDGRAGAPKYGMVYSYVGEPPEGAPAPTLSRVFE